MLEKILEFIPIERDFRAIDIALRAYPDSLRYDTEGRLCNRMAGPIAVKLRRMRFVIEVEHGIFWADELVKKANYIN